MRSRGAFVLASCVIVLGACWPDISRADSVATTAQATSIGQTSAILHGASNLAGASSLWAFQYGSTTAYGSHTPVSSVGPGVSVVSALVSGLKPGTGYHYRLVVAQGSPIRYSVGADQTFVTEPAFGRVVLRRARLRVMSGLALIPIKCKGARGAICAGRISLGGCGRGTLAAASPRNQLVRVRLSRRCRALLARTRPRTFAVLLKAIFTTPQRPIRTRVTLW
jgi:hypothetical protein